MQALCLLHPQSLSSSLDCPWSPHPANLSCRNAHECCCLNLQVAELAAFVRARGAGSPAGVVLAGDLNCAPDTLEFAMLKVSRTGAGTGLQGRQSAGWLERPSMPFHKRMDPSCASHHPYPISRPRCCCRSCAMRGQRRSRCGWAPRLMHWKAASQVSAGQHSQGHAAFFMV